MDTNRPVRIALHAMLGNEEHIVSRMLESCWQFVDYWVIQCNGHDTTQQCVETFFADKGIPGFTYHTPWKSPGENRDHALQELLRSPHKCDWILRMDADEVLEVDASFDWAQLCQTQVDSWNIAALCAGIQYTRTWLWNTRREWRFFHDIRHERIGVDRDGQLHEDFERRTLPHQFRHKLSNDGVTWSDPKKFLTDALELERAVDLSTSTPESVVRAYYIGKSYFDFIMGKASRLGQVELTEYARRSIYFLQWAVKDASGELAFYSSLLLARIHRRLGNPQVAEMYLDECEEICPMRNEHLLEKLEILEALGERSNASVILDKMLLRPNPFPSCSFLIDRNAYADTGDHLSLLRERLSETL